MRNLIFGLVLLSSMVLYACENRFNKRNVSITVHDNRSDLNFKAQYPEHKTSAAQKYIETYFKENRIFAALYEEKKVEIALSDGTRFYLSYEPGYMSINFEKDKNSIVSYHRMKKMVAGFGNVIKD